MFIHLCRVLSHIKSYPSAGALWERQRHFLRPQRARGHGQLGIWCQGTHLHLCSRTPRWGSSWIIQSKTRRVSGTARQVRVDDVLMIVIQYNVADEILWNPGGFVYFGCDDGMMYALDEMNGAVIWSYNAFSPIRSSKVPWCKVRKAHWPNSDPFNQVSRWSIWIGQNETYILGTQWKSVRNLLNKVDFISEFPITAYSQHIFFLCSVLDEFCPKSHTVWGSGPWCWAGLLWHGSRGAVCRVGSHGGEVLGISIWWSHHFRRGVASGHQKVPTQSGSQVGTCWNFLWWKNVKNELCPIQLS